MPRTETVLSVLISCPSDLAEERQQIVELIASINREWARYGGVRLEAMSWDTDAHSAMGEDPQQVINDQLNDYDIFIGLMWHRFGAPTPRAGSGTIEEFIEAKKRHLETAGEIAVSFYFKDSPLSPSQIDMAQLQKVLDFKKSMTGNGQLYREFTDSRSLDNLLRLQLSRHLQGQRVSSGSDGGAEGASLALTLPPSSIEGDRWPPMDDGEDEDAGLLDLVATSNEELDEVRKIVERLSNGMGAMTSKTTKSTAELQSIIDTGPRSDPGPVLKILGSLADDMEAFAASIDGELPSYRQSFRTGMDAAIKAAELSQLQLDEQQAAQKMEETHLALRTLEANLAPAIESLAGFRNSLAAQPRMSKKMIKAGRRLVRSLDGLLEEWTDNLAFIANLTK